MRHALILTLAMCCAASAQSMCGDCDSDGGVTVLDALVAAQLAAGLDTTRFPQLDLHACDVAAPQAMRSGVTVTPPVMTILDALRIAQWSLGIGAPLVCA